MFVLKIASHISKDGIKLVLYPKMTLDFSSSTFKSPVLGLQAHTTTSILYGCETKASHILGKHFIYGATSPDRDQVNF